MSESSSSTDPRYLIGRLGRPHGLDGYLGLYVDDEDLVYFQEGRTVLVEESPHTVEAIRRADKGHQVKFVGISTREHAEQIRGSDIHTTQRRDLREDEYWPEDLIGIEVRDVSGSRIGTIKSLITGGAQDRLVVDVAGASHEVPFVAELVPTVDLAAGYVEIEVIPGLIES